jgi:hypothetical protein
MANYKPTFLILILILIPLLSACGADGLEDTPWGSGYSQCRVAAEGERSNIYPHRATRSYQHTYTAHACPHGATRSHRHACTTHAYRSATAAHLALFLGPMVIGLPTNEPYRGWARSQIRWAGEHCVARRRRSGNAGDGTKAPGAGYPHFGPVGQFGPIGRLLAEIATSRGL